jgi:hypothetical protein
MTRKRAWMTAVLKSLTVLVLVIAPIGQADDAATRPAALGSCVATSAPRAPVPDDLERHVNAGHGPLLPGVGTPAASDSVLNTDKACGGTHENGQPTEWPLPESFEVMTNPYRTDGWACTETSFPSGTIFITVFGLVKYANEPRFGDPIYSGVWTPGSSLPPRWSGTTGLYVAGWKVPAIEYSDDHIYTYAKSWSGGQVCARFQDSDYADNGGTFGVVIE